MPEIFTIKASDLVLKVSENIDPARFDISKYEAFLDALCGAGQFVLLLRRNQSVCLRAL